MSKKVAIVGFAGTRDMAPYNDPETEIWSVNNLYQFIPRTDRIFQLHSLKALEGNHHGQDGNEHLDFLRQCPVPVYMQDHYDDIPSSVAYPLETMVEEFGIPRLGDTKKDAYFTNSISFMLALAIYEGFEHIGIYGVDMAVLCLGPDTKVLTTDLRWVRCADVKVGDKLMGFDEFADSGDGTSRKWRTATVTNAVETVKPCYEIIMEDGTRFIASEDHKWLTHAENTNRWRKSSQLVTPHHRDGRPTRIIKAVGTWDTERSWETGYLAAAFDGEGCLSQRVRSQHPRLYHCDLTFAQRENEMKEQVCGLLDRYGFEYSVYEKDCGTHQLQIRGGKPEVLRFLGQIRPLRLLPNFDPEAMGEFQSRNNVAVVEARDIGEQPVIALGTDTKTFIAEGFASHNSEYNEQRPSCEYYLGIAKGKGITIDLPVESDLLKTRFVYGFEDVQKHAFELKLDKTVKEMQNRKVQSDTLIRNQQSVSDKYEGAITALLEMHKTWS